MDKMRKAIKKMKERKKNVESRIGDAFVLWRRATIEIERMRRERMELDRHERLKVLGEEIAKFEMPY